MTPAPGRSDADAMDEIQRIVAARGLRITTDDRGWRVADDDRDEAR